MHVLVLCDDRWHPAHIVRDGLEPLTSEGLTCDWAESVANWSADQLENYPVVMLSKANNVSASDESPWMTPEIESAFKRYVESGHGLLVVHSGIAGYEQNPVLRKLFGGVFVSHPEQCPVTVRGKVEHPICAGFQPFTLKDEHYMITVDDPEIEVFLTTVSEYGEQPGGWTRTEGKGRVCVLTPGHNLENWQHPSFQILLNNALKWVSRS